MEKYGFQLLDSRQNLLFCHLDLKRRVASPHSIIFEQWLFAVPQMHQSDL